MTKRIVFGAALALVIVGLMAPSASASCANSKSVSTYNALTTVYTYWQTSLQGPGTTLVAKLWQPGGPDVTGTCNVRNSADGNRGILYFGLTPGDIGLSVNLADVCVGGGAAACANGQLAVMATVSKAGKTEFLMSQAPETPGGNITYDFSTFSSPPHVMAGIPRPRVTASSRSGATVTANVTVDAANAAAYEGTGPLITGYNILSKLSAADPGRLAVGYDAGPVLAASGGGPVTTSIPVDCSGSSPTLGRRWVVTQLVTANGPSPTVSEATQVACDPSLADPKFKIIPKPKVVPNAKAKR